MLPTMSDTNKHVRVALRSICAVLGPSVVSDSATPWTVTDQAPPPMGLFRQGYWSGLQFPSPEDLPSLGIEPGSPALQADSLMSYKGIPHHSLAPGK